PRVIAWLLAAIALAGVAGAQASGEPSDAEAPQPARAEDGGRRSGVRRDVPGAGGLRGLRVGRFPGSLGPGDAG
ncbi:MAG: hypothetical protein AAFY88_28880, partial [Acidobacteriota bacterium]